jgi:hypothetical protein
LLMQEWTTPMQRSENSEEEAGISCSSQKSALIGRP